MEHPGSMRCSIGSPLSLIRDAGAAHANELGPWLYEYVPAVNIGPVTRSWE